MANLKWVSEERWEVIRPSIRNEKPLGYLYLSPDKSEYLFEPSGEIFDRKQLTRLAEQLEEANSNLWIRRKRQNE